MYNEFVTVQVGIGRKRAVRRQDLGPHPVATSRTVRELHSAGLLRESACGRRDATTTVRTLIVTTAGHAWMKLPAAVTKRGTSNSNSRGGSDSRRRRRQWLLDTFGDGTTALCSLRLAGCVDADLTIDTVSVDRIVPGCEGGTYRRGNIRPACGSCNSKHGAQLGNDRKGTRS